VTRPRLTPRRVRAAAAALALLAFAACQQRMAHPPYYRPLQETNFFPDHRSSRPLEEGVVHRAQILTDDPLGSGLTAQGKQPQTVSILNEAGAPVDTKTGPGIPNKLDNFVPAFPFQVTGDDLKRGQQRFQIYCVPCHGTAGNGRGKIVERGFLEPPSFHTRPVDHEEQLYRERQRRDNPDALPLGMSRGFSFYRDPATGQNFRVPLRDVPVGYIFEVISRGYGGMPDYAHQIAVPDRWRIAAYVRTLQLSQNPPGGKP
jgi:mono/diheme cytochrome c family protein